MGMGWVEDAVGEERLRRRRKKLTTGPDTFDSGVESRGLESEEADECSAW